jgi:hypothetical protein
MSLNFGTNFGINFYKTAIIIPPSRTEGERRGPERRAGSQQVSARGTGWFRHHAQQLYLYKLALSKRTGIPMSDIATASFNENGYVEFQ